MFKQPTLIDQAGDQYLFSERDFPNEFHRIVFGAIFNLHQMGVDHLTIKEIETYLQNYEQDYARYKVENGAEWLAEAIKNAEPDNFSYYCSRVKKMTLLREYAAIGLDLSFIYDVNNFQDAAKKKRQEEFLDNASLDELANLIDERIENIRREVVDNFTDDAIVIGDVIDNVLEELNEAPDMGTPLYGRYVNTVTRGARLKKLYLRSAASGVGKTRSLLADACYIACDKIYSLEDQKWIDNGIKQSTLFISTEMEIKELVTMAIAFLSGVNEEHILTQTLEFDEKERVNTAVEILKSSPLYMEELPDFNLRDIENTIKKNIRTNKTQYIFLDYIHTSIKILEEILKKCTEESKET